MFVGGPWHGQVRTVDAPRVLAPERPDISLDRPDAYIEPRQVAYTLSRFALLGRIIWIGHLGAKPDDSQLFEALVGDGAKMAEEPLGLAHA